MVIQFLIKWINRNFSECATKTERNATQCDTLFIDAFQLYFNALESSEDHDTFVRKYLGSVRNSVLSSNPSQTIFIFLDGPCPAIRFQKLRERWFASCHIDGFEIDNDDFELDERESDEETAHAALEKYIKKLINYDNVNAKSIIYSSVTTPGEAKYKFFNYFREMKNDKDYIENSRNFILSNTNEMFFLALQFIDDHFFILKPNHMLYDIDIFRNLILYYMTLEEPFPGSNGADQQHNKINKEQYDSVVSKMNHHLKQQIINDVIGLSIVVSSENFPPFPEIKRLGTTAYTFSKVLNSYKELNQPYISIQIRMSANKTKASKIPEFTPLIVDNCFCLPSLQKIMRKFMQIYCENKKVGKKAADVNKNSKANKNVNAFDIGIDVSNDFYQSKNDGPNLHSKPKSKKKSNKKEANIFDVGIYDSDDDDNESDNDENVQDETEFEDKIDDNHYSENNNDFDFEICNEEDDDDENNVDDYQIESQQLFRLFNFTWQLYSNNCPSWSFYYQFKGSPPLDIALDLMQQEGIEAFNTEDANDITDPMFKNFVIYPVEVKNQFPPCLYDLKIPPSPIAKYWPLGAVDPKDIPIMNLKEVKKYFNAARKKMNESELRQGEISKTEVITKSPKRRQQSRFNRQGFQQPRTYNVNPFDDF